MIEPRRAGPPVLVSVLMLVLVACAGSAGSSGPAGGASTEPSAPASTAASEEPAAAVPEDGIPTACLTLSDVECVRARTLALDALLPTDPRPIYIQVGPFGCAAGDRCAPTLAARPEGDVVIEFPGGTGANVHLVVDGAGAATTTRDEAMGVPVEPTSAGGLPAGPLDFALGHCGVLSGIDVAGSWWDPVGQVAMDTGAAVNATSGVFTVTGEDRATWVGEGLTLQLVRRDGPKLLPFCM